MLSLSLLACSGEAPSSGDVPDSSSQWREPTESHEVGGTGGTGSVIPGTGGAVADPGAGGSNTGGSSVEASGGSPEPSTGGTGGALCPHFDPECATGGANSNTGGSTGTPTDPDFTLLWQDDFDSFNESRWARRDHTFPENASYFSHDNVRIQDGKLALHLTANPSFNPGNEFDKPYLGAEVGTNELFQYVRITARIRFAEGQGVISSLFTFAEDANVFWNEIDVEYLGYQEQSVQYNLITSNCYGCGSDRTAIPYPDAIGVAPYGDFYEYQITWTPAGVSFSVNGIPRWTRAAPDMTEPVSIRMNIWPTSELDPFAGTLDPSAIPTSAEYDWLRVEQYIGD